MLHIEGIEEEFQLYTLISQEVKPVRDVSHFHRTCHDLFFSSWFWCFFCLRLRFVKLWSMMHRGSIKTNQLLGRGTGANIQYVGWWISDGMEWWNGCRCQLVGRRNNSNWVLTKPDLEQSVRKVSEFFSRSSLQLSSYLSSGLIEGSNCETKVNTSLAAKFEFSTIFGNEQKPKLIAFLIWEDFFSFCQLLQD